MKIGLFEQGTTIEIHQRRYRCMGRGPGGRLRLENCRTGSVAHWTPERLNTQLLRGFARIVPANVPQGFVQPVLPTRLIPGDLGTIPEAEQAATLRRYQYVLAVRKAALPSYTKERLVPVIAAQSKAMADGKPPSWRSVARWVKAYSISQSVLCLVAEPRGNSHARFGAELEHLMLMVVDRHYLTPARTSLKNTHKLLLVQLQDENELLPEDRKLPKVSYMALHRFVSRMDKFDVMCRRFGEAYARRWFRAYKIGVVAYRPLEIVQVDHTILDVNVLFMGVIRLGRPTITIFLDSYTRMIVGFHISFEPPSYVTVMEALRFSILPKNDLLAPLKAAGIIHNDWPINGVPETLLLDNAKEFHGNDLKNAAAHLGMSLRYAPPKIPWFKGSVERFLLTLKESLIARLPGRTFPIREERGDASEPEVGIDLDDLQVIMTKWVVDVYHESPHRSNGLPPRAMYESAVRGQAWF